MPEQCGAPCRSSVAHHAEVLPIMPMLDRHIGPTETQHIPYLIEQEERAAEEQMPYWRRLLQASMVGPLPAPGR